MGVSAKKMAKRVARMIAHEQPNYDYIRDLFRYVREELDISVTSKPKRLPYVPTESELKNFYRAVWNGNNPVHLLMIKVLMYTGVRVSELITIELTDVDLHACQIRIIEGKGKKDRQVPLPEHFKEALAVYQHQQIEEKRKYLFESRFRRHYSDRGVRKILAKYTQEAGITHPISPHQLRHFLFTWLKKQNIDDALIQPYSGHEKRESLEVYSKLSITEAQKKYDEVINDFPV